jgi:hypothetical protein
MITTDPIIDNDAFEDATFCDQCGRENCEGHIPPDDVSAPTDEARREDRLMEAIEARAYSARGEARRGC